MVKIYDKQGKEFEVFAVDAREAIATGLYTLAVPTQEEIEASIEQAKKDDTAKDAAKIIMTPEKKPEDAKRTYNKKG